MAAVTTQTRVDPLANDYGDVTFWRDEVSGGYYLRNSFTEKYATLSGPLLINGELYFFTLGYIVSGRSGPDAVGPSARGAPEPVRGLSRVAAAARRIFNPPPRLNPQPARRLFGQRRRLDLEASLSATASPRVLPRPFDNSHLQQITWDELSGSIREGPNHNDFALVGPLPSGLIFCELHNFVGFQFGVQQLPRPRGNLDIRVAQRREVHGFFGGVGGSVVNGVRGDIWQFWPPRTQPNEAELAPDAPILADGGSLISVGTTMYGHIPARYLYIGGDAPSMNVVPAYRTYQDIVDLVGAPPSFPPLYMLGLEDPPAPPLPTAAPTVTGRLAKRDANISLTDYFFMATNTTAMITSTLAAIAGANVPH